MNNQDVLSVVYDFLNQKKGSNIVLADMFESAGYEDIAGSLRLHTPVILYCFLEFNINDCNSIEDVLASIVEMKFSTRLEAETFRKGFDDYYVLGENPVVFNMACFSVTELMDLYKKIYGDFFSCFYCGGNCPNQFPEKLCDGYVTDESNYYQTVRIDEN